MIEILDEAAEHVERDLGDQPTVAASLHLTIGSAYLNLGEPEKAERQLNAARGLQGSINVDLKLADIALKQGRLRLDRGRSDEAARLANQALASMETSFPDGHPSQAHPLVTLAEVELQAMRTEAALVYLERADAVTASLPPTTMTRADVLSSLENYREASAGQGSR